MRLPAVPLSVFLALSVLVAGTAGAADFSDPDWPCVQRKVPRLSVGQMWAGPPPIDEAVLKSWREDAKVAGLAPALAVRRTGMEEVESAVAEFAAGLDGLEKNARLAALFAGIFTLIDRERAEIIRGIARYARKQAGLAERIEERRVRLERLNAAAEPDLDRIEEERDYLDWDTRVFRDRAQSLAYVCETPVILERRAFALSRTIQRHLY